MPDKYRKAYALTKFWMNTFCHTACCMLRSWTDNLVELTP